MTMGHATGEWYVEAFWMLTSRLEARREPPGLVRVGAAAAALCDLTSHGEVEWADTAESADLVVQHKCKFPDPLLRQWHASVNELAVESRIEARNRLLPLIDRAWEDTAARLTATGLARAKPSRLPWRKPRYEVTDQRWAALRVSALARALREGTLAPFDRALTSLAWATNSFDDLFEVHGVTAKPAVTNAARDLAACEEVTGHLETAGAYCTNTLPYVGGAGTYM